ACDQTGRRSPATRQPSSATGPGAVFPRERWVAARERAGPAPAAGSPGGDADDARDSGGRGAPPYRSASSRRPSRSPRAAASSKSSTKGKTTVLRAAPRTKTVTAPTCLVQQQSSG